MAQGERHVVLERGNLQATTSPQDHFSAAFELLGDSVLVADADGRITYVNAAFEKTTGYKAEEVIGRPCNLLKSGSHPRDLYDELWSALRSGQPFRTIFTNRRKNGELYEEGMIISPILGVDRKVAYYLAIGREINALKQTFDAFLVLANNSPAGVYVSRNGRLAYVNKEVATFSGMAMQDMVDRPWEEFLAEDDRDRVRQETLDMLAGDRDRPIEFRMFRPDGDVRWMMQTVRRIEFREARFAGVDLVCGNLVDITDRHIAEEKLRRALSMQQATVDATTDGMMVTDSGGALLSSNHRFQVLWNLEHFVGPDAGLDAIYQAIQAQLTSPDVLVAAVERLARSPDASETVSVELLDGRVLELFSNAFVLDGTPQGRVWRWRDVTERRRFDMALLRLANNDSLTGLINRRRVQELMQESLTIPGHRPPAGALLMVDLDCFKEINDSLGHKAGDEVLIRVGATLRKTLPEQYVARFGGDEFAVFMPGATAVQARKAATDVVDAIESSWYSARGIDVPVTASIGIAVAPLHGTSPDELLANADLAMYAAKAAGRNRFRLYSQTIHKRASLETRRQIQADLQEAIEARRWKLYTRPALCLTNTGPTLHRLQPRFTRPDGSVVPESERVRIGEHAGLLKNLDRWLIEESSRTLLEISDGGGRAVSIALPWQTLTDRAMVAAMTAAMRKDLPDDASVFVELTGLDTMQETRSVAKTMTGLRNHGYRFVLCVQGPPLLKLAQSLPVDLVQLQRSIVADIHRDRVTRELVTSLVRALHGAGVGTMADDVNSAASLEYLTEAGVDYVRGSVVGRSRLASTLLRQLQPRAKAA